MSRFGTEHGVFLLACVVAIGAANQAPPRPAAGNPSPAAVKTALLSFPEHMCAGMEHSKPYAYIGFAFQIDGRVRYFKTSTTTCQNLRISFPPPPDKPFDAPMFGEQVTLYGADIPNRLRRENGDEFDIEPSTSSTTRSYFLPSVVLGVYDDPKRIGGNPHPNLVLQECRLLTDVSERDLCLWPQAGLQNDVTICDELSSTMRDKCRTWIANLRSAPPQER